MSALGIISVYAVVYFAKFGSADDYVSRGANYPEFLLPFGLTAAAVPVPAARHPRPSGRSGAAPTFV